MDLLSTRTLDNLTQGAASFLRVLAAVGLLMAVVTVLRLVRTRWVEHVAHRLERDRGRLHSAGLILNYLLALFAAGLIFPAMGVQLSKFALLLSALSVGIGFGLQTIVSNFVSGIVILLERPIKVDDRVLVDGIEGNIVDIGIRATTLRTNDGIFVIIPNTQFITGTVINRSLKGQTTRFRVPVGVSYDSDPRMVEAVLLRVAREHPAVLNDPPPFVVFESFGESALQFFLWVWTRDFVHQPMVFQSELNFAIHAALKEAGIEVPFRQVEVRVKGGAAPA